MWGYLRFLAGFGSTPIGNLTGTPLSLINAPSSTLDELRGFVAQFNLATFLKVIGEVAGEHERGNTRLLGVELRSHALAYVALVAIEASSDDRTNFPSRAAIADALRLFYGLPEPLVEEADTRPDAALEHAIRASYVQRRGGANLESLLARAWLIYGAAWARSPQATLFDIASAIDRVAGVRLEQLVFLSYAYSGQARKRGYVEPYEGAALATVPIPICVSEQQQFLERCSATSDETRAEAAALAVPTRDYEKYRLSPFFVKPLIRVNTLPPEAPPNAFVVPAPACLARRATEGVYHLLTKAYQGKGVANPFRTAFGFAFQECLGMLLEAGSPAGSVMVEWKYTSSGSLRDTPDWLVIDGDRLIVIEAKQSVLDLRAKTLGHLDLVAKGLENTLEKAARQLLSFRADVEHKAKGLESLTGVREVELLVVTYDDAHFANWILRDQVAKKVPRSAPPVP